MVALLLVLLAPEGLAAKYPGDKGIAGDPHVLLAEDFERGTMADVAKRWDDAKDKGSLAFATGVPKRSRGRRCLAVTATLGKNTGGHLYARLKRPVEQAYARFYVRFPKKAGYIHHFVHLGGYRPATPWPQGGAGTRPRGDERFTAGIEPHGDWGRAPPPGVWSFYAYWHEMKKSPDGKYWGNTFRATRQARVPRGTWQCVEIMLKCNRPDKRDGELALWLDGAPAGHFKDISWRKTADLKVNFFWLLHYVTEGALQRNRVADPPKTNTVWFDDIVVATKYIGPLR